jgi:hypothetical protein
MTAIMQAALSIVAMTSQNQKTAGHSQVWFPDLCTHGFIVHLNQVTPMQDSLQQLHVWRSASLGTWLWGLESHR